MHQIKNTPQISDLVQGPPHLYQIKITTEIFDLVALIWLVSSILDMNLRDASQFNATRSKIALVFLSGRGAADLAPNQIFHWYFLPAPWLHVAGPHPRAWDPEPRHQELGPRPGQQGHRPADSGNKINISSLIRRAKSQFFAIGRSPHRMLTP